MKPPAPVTSTRFAAVTVGSGCVEQRIRRVPRRDQRRFDAASRWRTPDRSSAHRARWPGAYGIEIMYKTSVSSTSVTNPCAKPFGTNSERRLAPVSSTPNQRRRVGDSGRRSTMTSKIDSRRTANELILAVRSGLKVHAAQCPLARIERHAALRHRGGQSPRRKFIGTETAREESSFILHASHVDDKGARQRRLA